MKLPDKLLEDKLKAYSGMITVSQIVKYFEKEGMVFTNTMIQNYVRVRLLPPPVNRMYYTKSHLLMLYLIYEFKKVYSLDELKRIFEPVTADFKNLDMFLIYRCYSEIYGNYAAEREENAESLKADIEKLSENPEMRVFLMRLSSMTEAAAAKEMSLL